MRLLASSGMTVTLRTAAPRVQHTFSTLLFGTVVQSAAQSSDVESVASASARAARHPGHRPRRGPVTASEPLDGVPAARCAGDRDPQPAPGTDRAPGAT